MRTREARHPTEAYSRVLVRYRPIRVFTVLNRRAVLGGLVGRKPDTGRPGRHAVRPAPIEVGRSPAEIRASGAPHGSRSAFLSPTATPSSATISSPGQPTSSVEDSGRRLLSRFGCGGLGLDSLDTFVTCSVCPSPVLSVQARATVVRVRGSSRRAWVTVAPPGGIGSRCRSGTTSRRIRYVYGKPLPRYGAWRRSRRRPRIQNRMIPVRAKARCCFVGIEAESATVDWCVGSCGTRSRGQGRWLVRFAASTSSCSTVASRSRSSNATTSLRSLGCDRTVASSCAT